MFESLFENFEKELALKGVLTKVQPFACNYALEATQILGMHDLQIYDQRLDDVIIREEDIEEPVMIMHMVISIDVTWM